MFENLATWQPPIGVEFPDRLKVNGEVLEIRWVASWTFDFGTSKRSQTSSIAYDYAGRFYATEVIREGKKEVATSISVIRPDQALRFILRKNLREDVFSDELLRELDSPLFTFMAGVVATEKKRKRRKRKSAPFQPFAVQLELATALVEAVRKLDATPDAAALAEARREASKLHQSLHSEEAFKAASVA